MKQFNFFILFLLSVSLISNAQTANNQAIDSLEQQIEIAVDKGNYSEAADLKKSLEMQIQIKQALDEGDLQKAAEIKRKLQNLKGKNNSTSSLEEDAVIYIYASPSVGGIGGYVTLPDGERVEIAGGDIKKVKVKAGKSTFTTNLSKSVSVINRTIEPGKIYFMQFASTLGPATWGVKMPDISFVNQNIFDSLTNFYGDIDKNYKIYDYNEKSKKAKLHLVKEKRIMKGFIDAGIADFLLNGEPVLKEFEWKNSYELNVPEGELEITMTFRFLKDHRELYQSIKYVIDTKEGEDRYITLETKSRPGRPEWIKMMEITKSEYQKIAKKKNKVVLK